jgi:hypothetical protein
MCTLGRLYAGTYQAAKASFSSFPFYQVLELECPLVLIGGPCQDES